MGRIFIILLTILTSSCANDTTDISDTYTHYTSKPFDTTANFVDSSEIGIPGKSKIILTNLTITSVHVKSIISFYTKTNGRWNLRNSYPDDYGHPPELIFATVADFNNDGKKDFLYSTGTGGRGGNSFQNLFIFDEPGDSLRFVINSLDYPNLEYNPETNSIISFSLTGSTETTFLKLDGNLLKPFASILQTGNFITVTEYDHIGNEVTSYTDSTKKYPRLTKFTNFRPVEY